MFYNGFIIAYISDRITRCCMYFEAIHLTYMDEIICIMYHVQCSNTIMITTSTFTFAEIKCEIKRGLYCSNVQAFFRKDFGEFKSTVVVLLF